MFFGSIVLEIREHNNNVSYGLTVLLNENKMTPNEVGRHGQHNENIMKPIKCKF